MPELPEVETIRLGLRRFLLRKQIVAVELKQVKVIRGDLVELHQALHGAQFSDITRRGKLLIFHLAKKKLYVLIHLKMTGQLIYEKGKTKVAGGHSFPSLTDPLPNKYSHLVITFADGGKLFFNDMRRFGYVELAGPERLAKVLATYGPEPLENGFTFAVFAKALGRRAISIKAVLLNQSVLAGIGNIYADESCFQAGIKPGRRVNSLTKNEKRALWLAIKKILKKALKYGGTTFSEYRDAEGKPGNFTRLLKVYGRGGKLCLKCRTTKLTKKKIASRGTVWCATCQR